MAEAPAVRRAPVHACPCLNVRIQPAEPLGAPPTDPTDSYFSHFFVGDDGIRVVHPHVTLRTRARGLPIEGTLQCGRYTTLTCLICDVLVYRVYQVVPIDVQGKEGPLLPTEDWVENEIMKSSNGWIELGSQCITDDAVQAAESSPCYSPLFSVVLPKLFTSSPTGQGPHDVVVVLSTVRSPSPQPPVSYLENMKPLLPPAPFTPSHPVFLHLAEIATAQSKTLRARAEEYITQIVNEKVTEVEKAEEQLRYQVEVIWSQFKTTIDRIKKEKEKPKSAAVTRASHEPTADPSRTTPVAIKEFVPVPISPARALSPSEGPRISALSVSLASSSFHHPRAASESHASGREANGSIHSRSSHSSERSGSTTLVRSPTREGGANVLQFPRNIDDGLNTAVSFRYFMDLEQEMEKKRKERLEEANKKYQVSQMEAGPASTPAAPAVNGTSAEQKPRESGDAQGKHLQVDTEGSVVDISEKSPTKGKRHVTFDVEPEVVTIDAGAKKPRLESSDGREQDPRADMIFELEEPEGDSPEPSTNGRPQAQLPLLEQQTVRPVRHRHVKSLSAGLPSSFSSLRPLSLPAPSHIRPPLSPHGADMSSQNVMMSLPRQTSLDRHRRLMTGRQMLTEVPEEELDPRDAVILRLVAADTPSHRGAWKPDSEAWKSLTQPLAGKGRGSADVSEEEGEAVSGLALLPREQTSRDTTEPLLDESGDYSQPRFAGVPGSLPIPIATVSKQKSPLSLASYQPQTVFVDQSGAIVQPFAPKHPSTAALRRASYAERDRQRAMDPGALDFATEDDEEASPSSDEEVQTIVQTDMGTRSRKRALKILQKRSAIPEEGMWRSLAT